MPNLVERTKRHLTDGPSGAPRKIVFWLSILFIAGCAHPRATDDRIDVPLTDVDGDPLRGQNVFVSRDAGHCVLCHAAPNISVAGNIGPSLQGVASRLSAAQLRLRVVDITRMNPDAVMPAFHRTAGLNHVAARYQDQPVLSARQVEDVVAFMGTLK